MAFEIPIDVDYFDHPKTVALMGMIGPEADVYPLRLWRWCARFAKNGKVTDGRVQIETAVRWTGKPGKLHRALIKCGFVEEDGITIHDFMEHIGRAIFLYDQKKKKQREKYAAGILPEENGRIPPIPSHPIRDEKSNPPLPPKGGSGKRKRQLKTDDEMRQEIEDAREREKQRREHAEKTL